MAEIEKRAVGFGVQQVALVTRGVSVPQRRGEDLGRDGQTGAQRADHAVRGVLPAEAAADLGTDRAHKAVRTCPGATAVGSPWRLAMVLAVLVSDMASPEVQASDHPSIDTNANRCIHA